MEKIKRDLRGISTKPTAAPHACQPRQRCVAAANELGLLLPEQIEACEDLLTLGIRHHREVAARAREVAQACAVAALDMRELAIVDLGEALAELLTVGQ